MKHASRRAALATAVAICSIGAMAPSAMANSSTSSPKAMSGGGSLTAYVYIDSWAGADNCGAFTTRASSTVTLASITENTDWDPIGVGASASIKGVGVSVSGNNGSSPSASNTNKNARSATISGTVCASWSTIYLGVYSTAVTKKNGTLYTVSAHV